jgi:hypothetical protein
MSETVITVKTNNTNAPSIRLEMQYSALETLLCTLYGSNNVELKFPDELNFKLTVTVEDSTIAEQVHAIICSVLVGTNFNVSFTDTEELYVDCLQNAIDLQFHGRPITSRMIAENYMAIKVEADRQYELEMESW